jgi:hypothetical protein
MGLPQRSVLFFTTALPTTPKNHCWATKDDGLEISEFLGATTPVDYPDGLVKFDNDPKHCYHSCVLG